MVPGYVPGKRSYPLRQSSASAGSKFYDLTYGSWRCPACQQLLQLLKTVSWIAFRQLSKNLDHWFIVPGIGQIKINCPAQR
jgi:hypothetical protein